MARSPRTFTPKKAGEEIGASADTIRRYCQLYRRHLSEGATPSPGKSRVLTSVDVYLLKLAKQATEAGSPVEEVDQLLSTVALPEDLVAAEEAGEGETHEGDAQLAPAGEAVSEAALALLRQMAATLDRLEARDRRFDQLAQEVADLRRVIESPPAPPAAPTGETPKPATFWSAYAPYVVAVAVVAFVILAIALVVALLR